MTDTTGVLAYYRVSTDEQGRSGLGLAAQRSVCRNFAAIRPGWEIIDSLTDVKSAGSLNGRHSLTEALRRMDAHEADILLSSALDRISRSVMDFAAILERARKNKWALAVADISLDMTTPMGEFAAFTLINVAQLERRLIGQRTKAALAQIPRGTTHMDANGIEKGPPGQPIQIDGETETLIRYMRTQGKTFRGICDELTALGKVPPRGGKWQVGTIQRVLAR